MMPSRMRDLAGTFPARALAALLHAFPMVFALSIPVVLALQTVYMDGHWTLIAWEEAWTARERWFTLLANTLFVGASATGIAIPTGLFLAILGFKTRWAGRWVLVLILFLLACVPIYVTSTAFLAAIGLDACFGSAAAAALVHGVVSIPLAALLIGLGLVATDPAVEEAALLEQSAWRVVRSVSIPQSAWSIAAATLIIFWLVVTDYSIADALQVRTFAEEIFTQYQLKGERVRPFILALPPMVFMAGAFFMLQRQARFFATPLFQGPAREPFMPLLSGGPRWLAWSATLVLMIGAIGALAMLISRIGSLRQLQTAIVSIRRDWLTTATVACLTAGTVAVLSFSCAWVLAKGARWKILTGLTLLCLIAIPAPTLGMTLLWYFNRSEPAWLMDLIEPLYARTPLVYVLAIGLRFLPVGVLIILPGVYRLPDSHDDAARTDGAGRLQRLVWVYWPACRVNIALAFLILMILAVGEFNCVHIVSPPGIETLSKRFAGFIHSGIQTDIATICLASTVTTALPAVLLFFLSRKKLRL